MVPFEPTTWGSWAEPLVHVLLGIGFGFALERAGFGSARKLTSQFYLNDLAVLKVMFTAIVTAMLLIFGAFTIGWLDYDQLFVSPTFLWPQIVGGLLFGTGFVIGGYCPGTAVVAASNLKLDAFFFVGGLLVGILGFGYTVPAIELFWHNAGAHGVETLPEVFGVDPPVAVLGVVLLALGMFAGGEWIERRFARTEETGGGQ
ncbi:MAG: YeeE/YedE family protein [Deltaproteobacteria bacterium]|nr:YeeE/YedE family protein [Deltaproteobacteria bacterium]